MERALVLGFRSDVVAVGNRLEIGEGKIAVDVARDSGKRVSEADDLLALEHAINIDVCVGRVEAGIAHENDGQSVQARAWCGIPSVGDRCGELGPVAGNRARSGIEQAAGRRQKRDPHRCNPERSAPAACHDLSTLTSAPGPPPRGRGG